MSVEKQQAIVKVLKTVFDPEIPVNIYDLGLIYRIEVEGSEAIVDMTFTAPSCPAAEFILEDVRMKVAGVEGIEKASGINVAGKIIETIRSDFEKHE